MEKEIWKPVLGYEETYFVSNKGRVKNKKGYIMKPYTNAKGYLRLNLSYGKPTKKFIHRMVWEAFNEPIPEGLQINHLNENKADNRLENLSLCTPKENTNYGTRNKRASEKHCKRIQMLDKNNNTLKTFNSLTEAARFLNIKSHGNISHCLHGKSKSAYEYKWKFEA